MRENTASATKLRSEIVHGSAETFGALHFGLPVQQRARFGDIRLPHARIVYGQFFINDGTLAPGKRNNLLRQLMGKISK